MAEKKQEKSLERVYTVPLRKSFINAPPYRKSQKAVKALRDFLARHMKSEDVRLGQHVNEFIWQHGIKSPPPRVTVKAVKDSEGVVRAELEGKEYKESVRPLPKEEKGTSLKDRLAGGLGRKESKEEAESEKKDETAESKPEPKAEKPAAKPKAAEKKE